MLKSATINSIEVGTRIFINGQSVTEEYQVTKIGRIYAQLNSKNHRYLIAKNMVEIKRKDCIRHTPAFVSPEDAEYWLEGEMQNS
jgi:hypothetical protein